MIAFSELLPFLRLPSRDECLPINNRTFSPREARPVAADDQTISVEVVELGKREQQAQTRHIYIYIYPPSCFLARAGVSLVIRRINKKKIKEKKIGGLQKSVSSPNRGVSA